MGARWGVRYGSWWAVQWSVDGTFSIGVHVDPVPRRSARGRYGPYLDLHVGLIVVSFGVHPARASDFPVLFGQGATMRADR